MKIRAGAHSDPGRKRAQNEDAYVCLPALGVFLVADGMGGHQFGQAASRALARHVTEIFGTNNPPPAGRVVGSGGPLSERPARLVAAIHLADQEIYRDLGGSGARTAGSTVVAVVTTERSLLVVSAGDSRAYLVRGGRLAQITTDHTQVQEMVAAGVLAADDAGGHPLGHVLTRAVGVSGQTPVDVFRLEPLPGDRLVLCSDGLTGEVSEEDLLETCRTGDEPDAVARNLVARAVENGGRDNVTAVVLFVDGDQEPAAASVVERPTGDLHMTSPAHFLGAYRWQPEAGDAATAAAPIERAASESPTPGVASPPAAASPELPKAPPEPEPPRPSVALLGVALALLGLIAYVVWAMQNL